MNQVLEAASPVVDHHAHAHDLAVMVITPAGVYPSEDEYRRALSTEKIEVVLAAAAKALELTDTTDWVVKSHDRKLNPKATFHEEHLHGIVDIHWHKPEGGGGA